MFNHCGRSNASLTEHHGKVSDVQIVRKTWVLSSFLVSVSLSLCVVLCCVVVVLVVVVVVVVKGVREGGGRRREETNRTIWAKVSFKIAQTEQPYKTIQWLIPSAVSLRNAGTGQLHQAQRTFGGIGNVLLSTYSHT